jgi:hypothetical protein
VQSHTQPTSLRTPRSQALDSSWLLNETVRRHYCHDHRPTFRSRASGAQSLRSQYDSSQLRRRLILSAPKSRVQASLSATSTISRGSPPRASQTSTYPAKRRNDGIADRYPRRKGRRGIRRVRNRSICWRGRRRRGFIWLPTQSMDMLRPSSRARLYSGRAPVCCSGSPCMGVRWWRIGLSFAVPRGCAVDRQSWEPGAGVVPCLRRATVVRVPVWVTSTGRATGWTVSQAGVHVGEFAAAIHVVGSNGWRGWADERGHGAEVVRAAAVLVADANVSVTKDTLGRSDDHPTCTSRAHFGLRVVFTVNPYKVSLLVVGTTYRPYLLHHIYTRSPHFITPSIGITLGRS